MNKIYFKPFLSDQNLMGKMWIGTVVDNADPESAHRIRVEIEGLTKGLPKDDLPWYSVAQEMSNSGAKVPSNGTRVKIDFLTNDIYNGMAVYAIASHSPK